MIDPCRKLRLFLLKMGKHLLPYQYANVQESTLHTNMKHSVALLTYHYAKCAGISTLNTNSQWPCGRAKVIVY